MQAKFLFVGPKSSWKISRTRLVVLCAFASGLLALLIAISIFQFFSYHTLVAELRINYENQMTTNQQLRSNLKELEEEQLVLERQVDQKKFLLAVTKKPDSIIKKEDETALQTKEKELLQEITDLQNTLNARANRIVELEAQNKQSQSAIQELFQKIPLVKRQVLSQSTTTPFASIPSQTIPPLDLMIDQFRMTVKKKSIEVQFNIRNTGNKTQAGFVIVRALRQEELGEEIPFNRSQSMRFVIKRYRPFSKTFKQTSTNPYIALRLIVWDLNENRLLEEHYAVE